MMVKEKIIDAKLRYSINREAAKISALPSGKNDEHKYFKVEKILPSGPSIHQLENQLKNRQIRSKSMEINRVMLL